MVKRMINGMINGDGENDLYFWLFLTYKDAFRFDSWSMLDIA